MINFLKMNGAGNDFVILDARLAPLALDVQTIQRLCARTNEKTHGCDQLVVLEAVAGDPSSTFMRIFNAGGSSSGACGNATRCVAWLIMKEQGADTATIGTVAGNLFCERAGENLIRVDMGAPRLAHAEIPVASGVDLMNVDCGVLSHGVAVGMGNPHVVFFVEDADAIPLEKIGPEIEHRTDIFPERVNVSVACMISSPLVGEDQGGGHAAISCVSPPTPTLPHKGGGKIKLRVWERGSGLTKACGTAACATLVAAVQKGLCEPKAQVSLPGGKLFVEWRASDRHVLLTGPVEWEFEGTA